MLKTIRKRQNNLLFSLLIFAIVAVMAMFGVADYNQQQTAGNRPAVKVNGEVISMYEFSQELQSRLAQYQAILGKNYDEKLIQSFRIPEQTLEAMIRRTLLAQQAKQLDIEASNVELAHFIRGIPGFQKDGKFDAELYKKYPNRGIEEKRQRAALAADRLRTYVSDRVRLTPKQIERETRLRETKLDLDVYKIDFNELTQKYNPSPSEIQKVLDSGPNERFEEYYAAHKTEYSEPASFQFNQIRVGTPFQASPETLEAARIKIEGIRGTLKPETFTTVAKAQSDDEYASKGGARGWVTQDKLEKEFASVLANLASNQISDTIKTDSGYFVLQLVDKKPETTLPLEAVKPKIARALAIEDYRKTFESSKKKEWEALLASGKSIAPELKALNISPKKTGEFSLERNYIPQIGAVDPVLDEVYQLKKVGDFSKTLPYHQSAYYFLVLSKLSLPSGDALEKGRENTIRSVESNMQIEILGKWLANLEKNSTINKAKEFEGQPAEPTLPF